jgi:hypothetical protein
MWDIGTHALGSGIICNLDSYILKVAKEDCPKGRNNDLGGPTLSFLTPSFVIIEATTLGLMGVWPVLVLARLQSTQLCSNQR